MAAAGLLTWLLLALQVLTTAAGGGSSPGAVNATPRAWAAAFAALPPLS
ncbi:hypothetical protein WJ438_00905 [Streptomyces sp. GD-15H]